MTDAEPDLWPSPRSTPDLIGHDAAERQVLEAWRVGRMPHGWLIAGPPGIGKATFAFRFARFALAAEGAGSAGDGMYLAPDHPVFRRVASGGHSDLMTLERGIDRATKRRRSVIVVEDVRAAGGFLRLTAGEGGWRVLVVDAADDMNANAANALLKLLEEPPGRSLLLLVSHAPGRLPATIRSRCRRLTLGALAEGDVARLLRRHAPELDDSDTATLARMSEGSVGRALRLARNDGLALDRALANLLGGLPELDLPALHRFADRLSGAEAEAAYRTATELLTRRLAQAIRTEVDDGRPTDEGGGGDEARRLSGPAGVERRIELWDKITRLLAQAEGLNLDRKQTVLNIFHAVQSAGQA